MWHLVVVCAAVFGWQAFPDGPLANYIITGLFVAFLCLSIARKSPEWPAYVYGAVMGLLTAGCGGMYAEKMDGYSYLCDKGTGLPVSIISGAGALIVVSYMLTRKKK